MTHNINHIGERRIAFQLYLRAGRRPVDGSSGPVETKFNPYHDPTNGRFTFAPGGPRALSHIIISDSRMPRAALQSTSEYLRSAPRARNEAAIFDRRPGRGTDPAASSANESRPVLLALNRPSTRAGIGGNSRAFYDPMTLHQVFPGLRSAPGGAIIAAADNFLDITGPASRLTASLTQDLSHALIGQIEAIDPNYRFESLGSPSTIAGQVSQLNSLRFDRAAALYRVRGEARPLQVETLRFLQRRVDEAYAEGLRHLSAGRLDVRLSPREAIGNFVDRQVRRELRALYQQSGIDTRHGQIRVIGREYSSSGTDRTYRIPDARVGEIAFDVTLSRKLPSTPQVRGFFSSDFRPSAVVIVRPSQSGPNSTYIITRPGR